MTVGTIRAGTPDRPLEPGTSQTGTTLVLPWHRIALGVILALATGLNFYQLDRVGYGNTYYAAAVRSMLQSWHNFFFNSFDPGGFVTIDKPPLGFWFQVGSAKLFGFNGLSLMLPSAIAGVLSVWLLYYLVARVFGRTAGLVAALCLAVTPVAVADNRNNIIDSILVLFLLLGTWAVSRAAETGRLRWLLLAAALVGLGFNVKMLEAYLVVPAFGLTYLLGAPVRWPRRLLHLGAAALVLLGISFSWALAVDLTPASQRPWVDSTTTNSEIDLAIGYNGLDRLLGRNGPGGFRNGPRAAGNGLNGAARSGIVDRTAPGLGFDANGPAIAGTPPGGRTFRAPNGGGGGLFNNGPAGPLRLIDTNLGSQAGWLLPLALIGLLAAGVRWFRYPLEDEQHRGIIGLATAAARRLRAPFDQQQQALILWGAWLLTTGAFFSVAGFFHSYYLVTMAPAIAALAAIGVITLWQLYVRRSTILDLRGWLLPLSLVATAVVQAYILRDYPDWSRWLTPITVGGCIVAAVVLILARFRPHRRLRIWTPLAAAAGVLALLITPTVWAAQTVSNGSGGLTPNAGPASGFGGQGARFAGGAGFGRFAAGDGFSLGSGRRTGRAGGLTAFGGGRDGGNAVNTQLLRYLEQHQGTTKYLFATQNSQSAAPYIIQTGKPVMALGGFSGSDPIVAGDGLQTLVQNNTVRYFLLGGGGFGREGSSTGWVQQACTLVPSSDWQGAQQAGTDNQGFGTPGAGTGAQPGNTGGAQSGNPGFGAGGPPAGIPGGFGGFGQGQSLYDCASAAQ